MLQRTRPLSVSNADVGLFYAARTVEDAAQVVLATGRAEPVVTSGDEGAVAFHPAARTAAVPLAMAVQVADGVGAGDTFQAALLRWLAQHCAMNTSGIAALPSRSIAAELVFAARAAAMTSSRRGADLSQRAKLNWPKVDTGGDVAFPVARLVT